MEGEFIRGTEGTTCRYEQAIDSTMESEFIRGTEGRTCRSNRQSTQHRRANLSEEEKEEHAERDRMQNETDRGTWSAETWQERRNQNNIHQEQLRRERWALSSGEACECNIDSFDPNTMNVETNDPYQESTSHFQCPEHPVQ